LIDFTFACPLEGSRSGNIDNGRLTAAAAVVGRTAKIKAGEFDGFLSIFLHFYSKFSPLVVFVVFSFLPHFPVPWDHPAHKNRYFHRLYMISYRYDPSRFELEIPRYESRYYSEKSVKFIGLKIPECRVCGEPNHSVQ
jgi:hypothetical protein